MMRTVFMNPVEPSPFSARAPAGFDCVIDIRYRDFADQKWTDDPAATLVLTGRTTRRSASYLVPATDVINGLARVTIPGADLSDENGYQMTLVGTRDGARSVIATGIMVLSEAGIPEVAAADVIDTIALLLTRGEDATLQVNLWADAGKSVGYDLTGKTISAAIYDNTGGIPLAPFTVTSIDADSVGLTMLAAVVDTLPDACWWTLVIAGGGGSTTLAQGPVTVITP